MTLLDRPYRRLVDDLPLAHVGFTVPDELFAGYGLGLEETWRSLADLHFVAAEELPGVPVSLSSVVLPELREYERTITTVANGYV